jgi:uncharacterized membrane protein YhaH (DUF805 family)
VEELNPVEWAIRPLKKYAVFSGRAPRAEYWWYTLATFVLGFPLDVVDKYAGNTSFISGAFNLAIILPAMAVTVRRLHDTNRSGWWLLAFVVGFGLVGLVAAIGAATRSSSTAASFTGIMVAVLLMLITSITVLVFMVLPGTEGPNRYGPDPYGPDQLEEVFA